MFGKKEGITPEEVQIIIANQKSILANQKLIYEVEKSNESKLDQLLTQKSEPIIQAVEKKVAKEKKKAVKTTKKSTPSKKKPEKLVDKDVLGHNPEDFEWCKRQVGTNPSHKSVSAIWKNVTLELLQELKGGEITYTQFVRKIGGVYNKDRHHLSDALYELYVVSNYKFDFRRPEKDGKNAQTK